jgi:hypothetical protein
MELLRPLPPRITHGGVKPNLHTHRLSAQQQKYYKKCPEGLMPRADRKPSLRDVLDLLSLLEIKMSDLMRRWDDGVAPEIRAEIMVELYEPTLRLLIRARRRPLPR